MIALIDEQDVQQALCTHLHHKRKQMKLSRAKLAERSGVPAATIKHFESTGQISLRQFLLLWLCLDDLNRMYELTKTDKTQAMPTTIEEVLNNAF